MNKFEIDQAVLPDKNKYYSSGIIDYKRQDNGKLRLIPKQNSNESYKYIEFGKDVFPLDNALLDSFVKAVNNGVKFADAYNNLQEQVHQSF